MKHNEFVVKTRRALSMHGSIYLNIPKRFVRKLNIKAGNKLPIFLIGNIIKIIPVKEIDEENEI